MPAPDGAERAHGAAVEDGALEASACMVDVAGAVTCNQTLIQWLPAKRSIAELLAATPEERIQARAAPDQALIRVAYQTEVEANWRGVTASVVGRTLEEAFALENLAWCQHQDCAVNSHTSR